MPIEMFKRHETLRPGRAASGSRRQNIALSRVAGLHLLCQAPGFRGMENFGVIWSCPGRDNGSSEVRPLQEAFPGVAWAGGRISGREG